MATILITIIVSLAGHPVKGAHVHLEGMVWDFGNGDPVTDSRGHFIVESQEGTFRLTIRPKDGAGYSELQPINKKIRKIYVDLGPVESEKAR